MNTIPAREALGRLIWDTSRRDEGTISATGANVVADAILSAGWINPDRNLINRGRAWLNGFTAQRARQVRLDEQIRELEGQVIELEETISEVRDILTDTRRNTDNACLNASALLARKGKR
jgi:uncharacterized coiled-coil protein SlyX